MDFNLNFRKNKQMPRPWAINLADNKARWQSLAGKLMILIFCQRITIVRLVTHTRPETRFFSGSIVCSSGCLKAI